MDERDCMLAHDLLGMKMLCIVCILDLGCV
jgi:hypothetical protein